MSVQAAFVFSILSLTGRSYMSQPIYKHLDGGSVAELQNFLIGGGAALTTEKSFRYDNDRIEYRDSKGVKRLATTEDVLGSSLYRGGVSLSSNALPTAASASIRPNDPLAPGTIFYVSAGGSLSGINGADDLASGDILMLTGADPLLAASWTGVSRSLDVSPFLISATVILASLPANTATRIPPPASIKTVTGFILTLGGKVCNGCFEEDFATTGASAGVTLTSLVAKSNISCTYSGLTV
jgi:hypothetical protein